MGYKIGDYLTVMFRYGKPTMVQDDQMSTETLIVIGLKPGSEHFVEEAICYVPPDSICQTPHKVGTKELKEYGINSKYLGDSFISIMPGHVKKARNSISSAFCGRCCEPMPYVETKNGTHGGPILCWQCRNDPYRLFLILLQDNLSHLINVLCEDIGTTPLVTIPVNSVVLLLLFYKLI